MRVLLVTLFALAAQPAQPAQAGDLDENGTKALNGKYKDSKHWAMKGIILVALGKHWHPAGNEMILDALRSRDRRLRAFAVESLMGTDPEVLKMVATTDLVDELIRKQLKISNIHYRSRVLAVLKRVTSEVRSNKKSKWDSWWRKAKKTHAPAEWKPPADKKGSKQDGERKTVAGDFIDRAFDLNRYGLDVAIVIDSTGSMQATIDAARDGLKDLVAILKSIAPKFRIGLVHYKELGEMKDGAAILSPLSPQVNAVQEKLRKLQASGGGDFPERVEKGLLFALSGKMGWSASANKVILVIGDAPPHPTAVKEAIKLARDAREKPFGKKPSVATGTGKSKRMIRPFVVSTIGVGSTMVHNMTSTEFKAIAKAGGGAYGEILTSGTGKNAREIVSRILTLSFGQKWKDQMKMFVDIYLEYRAQGFYR